ncbi:MAG TPA: FecR domain-containing protein [Rhizomicrobium sp.]|nr:FecR domain-containing protein [Rhizomicrobium sp.]
MSEAHSNEMVSAAAIKARAAAWLERRDRADWSEADQAVLDAWLAESMAHMTAYWRLDAAWARTERLAALRSPSGEVMSSRGRLSIPPLVIGIAAALAILVVLGAGTLLLLRPEERTYATAVGGHESVAFEDGSKIELNTDTILRARMTTRERIVWLDKGEAYFQVRHDPSHPFVVMVGDRRITDLGTQFVIHRGVRKLEVAVLEGRVWLDAPDRQSSAQNSFLTTGEVATVSAEKISVTKKNVHDIANGLAWRHGVLVFKHKPLAEVAQEFNRYNTRKIVITDDAIGNLKIYGTFRTEDVDLFARVIQVAYRLNVETGENRIVISR